MSARDFPDAIDRRLDELSDIYGWTEMRAAWERLEAIGDKQHRLRATERLLRQREHQRQLRVAKDTEADAQLIADGQALLAEYATDDDGDIRDAMRAFMADLGKR